MPEESPQKATTRGTTVDKAKVLVALRGRGQDARAEFVDRQLPEIIDVDANAGLLRTLGLDIAELTS